MFNKALMGYGVLILIGFSIIGNFLNFSIYQTNKFRNFMAIPMLRLKLVN